MNVERGQTLSHYRLIEKIGEGGMGVVWKAEDTVLGRTVAIKVLPTDHARDEKRRKMFFDEARLASSVSEAHIVQVHEFGHESDLDFIVMEYVEGKPLNKMLHGKPMPPHRVAEIGNQVARALSKAHHKGLLHRDLKPANILITPDGDAKVVDFGLATLFSRGETHLGIEATTATEPDLTSARGKPSKGTKVGGTLPYMSPEQVRGEKLDTRSDIFSLGTVLYEMATGQRPFTGATNKDVVEEILKTRLKPVHEVVPKVPLDLDRIISKALSPRRGDRYQNTEDLAVDLKRLGRDLVSGSSPSYEELAKVVKPRRRWVGFAALVGVISVAAIAWLLVPMLGTAVDPNTILILPMEVRGQAEGAEYVGRAFSEAMVANLVQMKGLNILAVPKPGELGGGGTLDQNQAARDLGAGRLITGSITREREAVNASISLLDAVKNRVIWAIRENAPEGDLSRLASSLAREVAMEMGTSLGKGYDYWRNLTGGPEMAASPDTAQALGSLKNRDIESSLAATERLIEAFPEELDAYVLRATALYYARYNLSPSDYRTAHENSLLAIDRLDPENPYTEWHRSFSLSFEGRRREAIELLSDLLARDDLSIEFRIKVFGHRAWLNADLENISGALNDLEEALIHAPMDVGTLSSLSYTLQRDNRFEESLARAKQALYLDPNDGKSNDLAASNLSQLGNHEEALIFSLKSCETLRVQNSCANHAVYLQKAGLESEALKFAQEAASMVANWDGLMELAIYYNLVGNREKTLSYLRKSFDNGYVGSLYGPHFASLYGDPEFKAIALDVHEKACKENRTQASCSNFVLSLQESGNESRAFEVAKKTNAMDDTKWGTYGLACYWALRGNREEALRLLQRSLGLDLNDNSITEDPNLASLHGDPEFEAIVAEVERRIEAQKGSDKSD